MNVDYLFAVYSSLLFAYVVIFMCAMFQYMEKSSRRRAQGKALATQASINPIKITTSDLLTLSSKVSIWAILAPMLLGFYVALLESQRGGPTWFYHLLGHPSHFMGLLFFMVGPVIEVFWTSIYDAISTFARRKRLDYRFVGTTYLWMSLIYGFGAYLFGFVYSQITTIEWYWRGFIYLIGIYVVEYLSAKLLEKGIGVIPWNYSRHTNYHFQGAIRWDYAPAWFLFGLSMEQVYLTLLS